jgi:hypothetical protein
VGYTLGTAAKATGLNKSTILKALRSGKISGAKDEHGQWCLDPAELHRVYPPHSEAPGADNGAGNDRQPPDNGLAPTTAATDALVAELRSVIADLRQDRDAWREQAQRLALPSPGAPQGEPATAWRRFLHWRRAG